MRASIVGADGTAQDRRAGARIAVQFGGAEAWSPWRQGPSGAGRLDLRQVARLGGTALVGIEEAFDDAIFERMEADDGKDAALAQQTLGGKEAFDELVEFAVDGNAQRLEGARCRVRVTRLAADGLFDDASELRASSQSGQFRGPRR